MWYSLKVYFFITEWTLSPLFCDVHQTNDVKFNTVNCHTQTPTNYTVFFLHITHIAHHLGAGRVNCLAHSFVFLAFSLDHRCKHTKMRNAQLFAFAVFASDHFFLSTLSAALFHLLVKIGRKEIHFQNNFFGQNQQNRMHWFHQIPCGNSNPKKPNLQFAVELNYHLSWYLVISSN